MTTIKRLILFCIAFTIPTIVQAQWALLTNEADSLVLKGLDQIYNVQFDSASVSFKKIIDLYPDHPAGYFLESLTYWWKLKLNRGTKQYDPIFLEKIENVVTVCDKLLEENPTDIRALFFKGGAVGYRAQYYTQEKEWLKAASDGRDAYNLLTECIKKAPNNYDIKLGTGVYNYFAEAIPEKYPYLKPALLFFPSGDKRLGLLQLRASSIHARYTKIEAEVILLQIYHQFEEDWEASKVTAKSLHERYPRNAYFHRYYARALVRMGRWDEFEKEWREIAKKCIARTEGFDNRTARESFYYVGYAMKRKGKYDIAEKYLRKTIEGCDFLDEEDSGFAVKAYLHIAEMQLAQKKYSAAIDTYEKVLDLDDYRDSHDTADRQIEFIENLQKKK